MALQDRMIVEVAVEIEHEPTKAQLATMRDDARRLTDQPASIRVEHAPTTDRHVLTATFSMPFQAQYRVVDDIARRFKMGIGCEAGFLDLTIRFPKEGSSPRRRRH